MCFKYFDRYSFRGNHHVPLRAYAQRQCTDLDTYDDASHDGLYPLRDLLPEPDLAQLWQYLPMQRINDALLYDERLVRTGSHYVMSIPLGMRIYLGLTVVFSVMCFCHAVFSKDNI